MTVAVPRLRFSLDPLIAEAKRRARHRRLLVVLGGVLLAALVAGLALTLGLPGGPSGGRGGAGFNGTSLTGSRASVNQARLERGGPVKLLPGRVSTDALGMKASLAVPHGRPPLPSWYGEQKPGLLRLGKFLAAGGFEVSVFRAGIEVNALHSPLARSARMLETAARVQKVSSVRLGSLSGRRYSFSLNHAVTWPSGIGIGISEHDVILLGVPNGTLLIRKMPVLPFDAGDADQLRREAERVIQSFRFQT